jgi:hypothetical protein
MTDIYLALATASICVLFCTASITAFIRRFTRLFDCPFCLSWWVALGTILYQGNTQYVHIRWPAIVCLANVGILLIHLSMATMGEPDD